MTTVPKIWIKLRLSLWEQRTYPRSRSPDMPLLLSAQDMLSRQRGVVVLSSASQGAQSLQSPLPLIILL